MEDIKRNKKEQLTLKKRNFRGASTSGKFTRISALNAMVDNFEEN